MPADQITTGNQFLASQSASVELTHFFVFSLNNYYFAYQALQSLELGYPPSLRLPIGVDEKVLVSGEAEIILSPTLFVKEAIATIDKPRIVRFRYQNKSFALLISEPEKFVALPLKALSIFPSFLTTLRQSHSIPMLSFYEQHFIFIIDLPTIVEEAGLHF